MKSKVQDWTESQQLLTVAEIAARLRVPSSWVYGHSHELGAFRVGKYVRFTWERVISRLEVSTKLGSQPNDVNQR